MIFEHDGPSIKDILLLFIYLELAAMVGIYFKTKKLPVRFLMTHSLMSFMLASAAIGRCRMALINHGKSLHAKSL